MKLTPAQLKGRIKSLAQKNHADARILLRIFMMERFLERISVSDARHHFIIKGGILVTSMIGVALRSTMDRAQHSVCCALCFCFRFHPIQ